jgi:glycosyltransferase involved in cell wall biosynthesis
MRILVLSPESPFPPQTGGQSRTYYLLKALSEEHEITLVTFDQSGDGLEPSFPLRVERVPWEWPTPYRKMFEGDADAVAAAVDFLANVSDEPWFVSCYDSPSMRETLLRLQLHDFSLIIIEHTFMARFIPCLPRSLPLVLDLHNVHTLMALREAEREAVPEKKRAAMQEAERTRAFERRVCSAAQLCLTCSEPESEAVRTLLGVDHVRVVPNGVNTAQFHPDETGAPTSDLIFTGTMNYAPNVEAVKYFCAGILPLVHRQLPEVCLHIVGAKPTIEVKALATGQVVIHGSVPVVQPYFRRAAVAIVPLLHGGGTRLKILEAAASGKAIVSTSLGAEGLELRPGEDLIIADSPSEFANAIIQLLTDEDRREQLGHHAREAAERYDWDHIGKRLRALLAEERLSSARLVHGTLT